MPTLNDDDDTVTIQLPQLMWRAVIAACRRAQEGLRKDDPALETTVDDAVQIITAAIGGES
jgi:hypothetical protein